MRQTHWVSRSNNKKTGPVMVSYSPKATCPDSCSLKEGGCYAWGLFYIRNVGDKIAAGTITPRSFSEAFKGAARVMKIVRHRVAGDVLGDVPETLKECEEVASLGLINIGYTHAWREAEVQPLKAYFRASCQSIDEVIEARKQGWSATLIVNDLAGEKKVTLPNGETAYLCPARVGVPDKKDITCNDCTLCKVSPATSGKTVVFEAHGNAATMKQIRSKVA